MHIFNEQWFWLLVSYVVYPIILGVQNEMIMKSFSLFFFSLLLMSSQEDSAISLQVPSKDIHL